MAIATSQPPVRHIQDTVNSLIGVVGQSAMLISYRVWDYAYEHHWASMSDIMSVLFKSQLWPFLKVLKIALFGPSSKSSVWFADSVVCGVDIVVLLYCSYCAHCGKTPHCGKTLCGGNVQNWFEMKLIFKDISSTLDANCEDVFDLMFNLFKLSIIQTIEHTVTQNYVGLHCQHFAIFVVI